MADNLTPEQRKRCMTSIKSKDTKIEVVLRSAIHSKGFRFRKHVKELPGKPDIVFTKARLVVFINGDYWHGYRFRKWKDRVSDYWQTKISKNRTRDCKNFRTLRKSGWHIIRVWEHDVEKHLDEVVERITTRYHELRNQI